MPECWINKNEIKNDVCIHYWNPLTISSHIWQLYQFSLFVRRTKKRSKIIIVGRHRTNGNLFYESKAITPSNKNWIQNVKVHSPANYIYAYSPTFCIPFNLACAQMHRPLTDWTIDCNILPKQKWDPHSPRAKRWKYISLEIIISFTCRRCVCVYVLFLFTVD